MPLPGSTALQPKAIRKLSDNGIFVGIRMKPVLPFITDNEEDIKKLVKLAYEHGAKFIQTFMVKSEGINVKGEFEKQF